MSGNRFDLWYARFIRSAAAFMGLVIMGYETIGDHSDRPWLYAAALGMMGLPIARGFESVLSKKFNVSIGDADPKAKDLPPANGAPPVEKRKREP